MISKDALRQVVPQASPARVALLLPHLNDAMVQYGIDSPAREAAFIAQLAHESGEFRWMEELWGPTAAQCRYEPQSTLARQLGNSQPGDGQRFKGRGPIQLTGRANYRRFGELLGVDLEAEPERAATPAVAFRIAGLYWASRGLNALADAGNFREITRRINGGFNGLVDRLKYYERAKAALAVAGSGAGPVTSKRPKAVVVPEVPLDRGYEAIRRFTNSAGRKRKTTGSATSRRTTARTTSPRKGGQARKKQRAD